MKSAGMRWLCLLLCLFETSPGLHGAGDDSFFTSSPGAILSDHGDAAILRWTYKGSYRPMTWYGSPRLRKLGDWGHKKVDNYVYIETDDSTRLREQRTPNEIAFVVFDIDWNDFGPYQCQTFTSKGNFTDSNAFIIPTGGIGPEIDFPPFGLSSPRSTAASLSLEWRAGTVSSSHTFHIYFTRLDDWFYSWWHRQLTLSSLQPGQTVQYKLNGENIEPGAHYQVKVTNELSSNPGGLIIPTIEAYTKGRPMFREGASNITILSGTAYITWPIINPDSVSHLNVTSCNTASNKCTSAVFADPTSQPYVMPVPLGTYLMFTFTFYDGDDVVNVLTNDYPTSQLQPPYGLSCTRRTAVSLYLEWYAGSPEGAASVHLGIVEDSGYSRIIPVTYEPDGIPSGQIMRFKLDRLHDRIQPEQMYQIRVETSYLTTTLTSNTVRPTTKAKPKFQKVDPVFDVSESTANITWPLENPESVTHILVTSCRGCGDLPADQYCVRTNVTEPSNQPFVVDVPKPTNSTRTCAKHIRFNFTFFDGEDKVNQLYETYLFSQKLVARSVDTLVIVCSVCLLVVCLLGGVLAAVMLHRRGKDTQQKPQDAPIPKQMQLKEAFDKLPPPVVSPGNVYVVGMETQEQSKA